MSATPAASNSDKTFTATPSDNLSGGTTFKLQITTSATDTSSNPLASAQTSNGFITTPSGSGTIKGSVKQDNGSALSGVSVSFAIYGSTVDTTTTFSVPNLAGNLWGVFTFDNSSGSFIASDNMSAQSTHENIK